ATSANISQKPASTEIKKVLKQFEKQKIKPDIVIDSGNLSKSRPSQIIDLTKEKIIIKKR
ncbi:MAG: Sua5/YciO/YrdC/YwlC family protein, partial [Candidatus Pacebacteria bacterium]|nr:Sua5/YciO/YrdC/YwlC family protein [Candidatus Paceibacterota bacterium]